jgi:hypothetical protein
MRFRLATATAIFAGVILLAGPVRLTGQWVDHCRHHFGWTHAELITSFVLGAVAFIIGNDDEHDSARLGQLIGGFVTVGAVVTFAMLLGRGCGD